MTRCQCSDSKPQRYANNPGFGRGDNSIAYTISPFCIISKSTKEVGTEQPSSNEWVGRLERLRVENGQPMTEPPYRGEDQQAEHIPAGQKPELRVGDELGLGVGVPGLLYLDDAL
uniref:Uncharacterized protein n=1 Tax=Arundo donax TaxID=35708 RepID=A0A0A9F6E2_ARUDO